MLLKAQPYFRPRLGLTPVRRGPGRLAFPADFHLPGRAAALPSAVSPALPSPLAGLTVPSSCCRETTSRRKRTDCPRTKRVKDLVFCSLLRFFLGRSFKGTAGGAGVSWWRCSVVCRRGKVAFLMA